MASFLTPKMNINITCHTDTTRKNQCGFVWFQVSHEAIYQETVQSNNYEKKKAPPTCSSLAFASLKSLSPSPAGTNQITAKRETR